MGGRHYKKDRYGMNGNNGAISDGNINKGNDNTQEKNYNDKNVKAEIQTINCKKPRYAKASGVKNNFQFGDNVYVSTFGKKDEIIIDKVNENGETTKIDSGYKYSINLNNQKLILNSNILPEDKKNLLINNNKVNKKFDAIGLNDKILKQIFTKDKYDDTIHIQIGYNILDMNKIISLYYYNIIYTINHLSRDTNYEMNQDFLGNMTYSFNISQYNKDIANWNFYDFNCKAKDRYLYFYPLSKLKIDKLSIFNNDLKTLNEKKSDLKKNQKTNANYENDKSNIENEIISKLDEINFLIKNNDLENEQTKYNYNVLRILCFIRNSIAHSTLRVKDQDKNKIDGINTLYKINNIKILPSDLEQLIDELFEKSLTEINDNFDENAKKNLWIISKLQNKNIGINLINKYYEYSILKKGKNIGVNIKKIRENILNNDFNHLVNKDEFRENRRKINQVYDFLIYSWLMTKDYYALKNVYITPIDDYIIELRKQSMSKANDAKDGIYNKITQDFRKTHYEVKDKIIPIIKESFNPKTNILISNSGIQKVSPNDFTLFSKLIYFISYFLSNKEKNELITALINKLDNINSLNNMYKEASNKNSHNDTIDYNEDYSLFSNAGEIADELRIINSLSHMQDFQIVNISNQVESSNELYKGLYIDALNSLGVNDSENIYSSLFNSDNKKETNIKNFIKNNIINSTRFQYIVKYIDPIECPIYIKCGCLIKSILNNMENSILVKNYNNLFDDSINEINVEKDKENVISVIYNKLLSFNYDFLCNRNLDNKNTEIEKIKSLGKLYYTVIYLAVKNLVNVNSIFAIACECMERDYSMVCKNGENVFGNDISLDKQLKLFSLLVDNYKSKNNHKKTIKKLKERFFDNENKCIFDNKEILPFIRNNVLHLTFISNASKYLNDINIEPQVSQNNNVLPIYYDLYVFILEKTLLENITVKLNKLENGKIIEKDYNKLVKKHPDKDLIKYLLIPFAYNLARYKNLTIRDLFYDQYKYLTEKKINEDSIHNK